jgi:hypothetical protein
MTEFEAMFEGKMEEMRGIAGRLEEGKNLNEMNGFSMKMKLLSDELEKGGGDYEQALNHLLGPGIEAIYNFNGEYIASLYLIADGGTYSPEEVEHFKERLQEEVEKIEESKAERLERVNELAERVKTENKELLTQFETDYEVALESLA